ncbi:ABC transporter substrate-binding protein [Melaminivora sp.]
MPFSSAPVVGAAAALLLAAGLAQAQPAQRIVTLQPSLTEAVCSLDACERLVGVDRHSDWPAGIASLPRVGGMAEANIEAIVALRPDLVLLGTRSRSAQRLQALGLRVLVLEATSHADIRRNLEAIAQALGKPGAGERLWRGLDLRVQEQRRRVPVAWQGRRVYLELHGGKAAASEESFIGETLALLGLVNVVPGRLGAFPRLGPEYALRADPDVLISTVVGSTVAPPQRPGWHALRAVREQRYCSLNAQQFDVVLRAGPRIDEAAAAVVQCLHRLPPPQP